MIDPVRRAAIVVLLGTLLDGLPDTAATRPLSTAGFVHDARARETCPDCFGEAPAQFGCETCRGRGFLEQRRRRDPYDTGRTKGYALVFGAEAREQAARRDREIDMLATQTAAPKATADQLAEANQRGEPWEVERARMRRDFDYPALERALEMLRDVDVDAYRAVFAVHVHRWLPMEGRAASAAERGLELLDAWMPHELDDDGVPVPLRAPAPRVEVDAEERSRSARNLRIRERFDVGRVSVKQLARDNGLSVSQVNRILNGEEGA